MLRRIILNRKNFGRLPGQWGICFLLLALSGCIKDSNNSNTGGGGAPDTVAPVVQITTPTANQQFNTGQAITISGRATDDQGLRTGTLRVYDAAGMLIDSQSFTFGTTTTYNFMSIYTPLSPSSSLTFSVSFTDMSGNASNQVVSVIVN